MKRYLPYILIGVVVLAALIALLATGKKNPARSTLNENISMRKRDKIPYGTFVAYQSLPRLFPQATVIVNKQEPGFWDSLSATERNQALLIVSDQFNADEYEMKKLVSFIEQGNDVFISALDVSAEAATFLNCDISATETLFSYFSDEPHPVLDTLEVSLTPVPFGTGSSYLYPGKRHDGYFSRVDTTIATVLGHDVLDRPNFIRVRAGEGSLYLHLAPMAFTNYFLLHRRNIGYYEKMLSLIPASTRRIAWDEYYANKKKSNENERKKHSNWFSVLLRYPAFRAGLLTILLALLVYTLLEMRRKQRFIPVVRRPVNDSLDFVRTIGRLYHDKGDHTNLSRKMAAYFLEYVRNRYKLPTNNLNDEFVKNLHHKTGIPEEELLSLAVFIRALDQQVTVNDRQLAEFHHQLESFYKKA